MAEYSEADLSVLGDRYEVSTPLGSGAAANVFLVRDRRTGAQRAAKILKPENAADPTVLARFEDEFRILRTFHHPHLPEVYDYGWTDDGGRFLIMELVDGVPLDEFFRSNPGDIWAILYELCETLTFVHNHKLLHQDVKPSNILVRRTTAFGPDLPLVKLIDFGLTYRRDTGAVVELVGTPEYMAPEVIRGERSLTRAVDYYSLGATLYELLCGRPPFMGPASQVMRAQLQREPVIMEEELEWAELYPHVRALLTKDWRARLEAFEEFRRAVTSRLTGGIDELDRAYGLARIDSLPMVGMEEAEEWLTQIDRVSLAETRRAPALEIRGRRGVARDRLVDSVSAECAIRGFHIVRFADQARSFMQTDTPHSRQVDRFDKAIARFESLHPAGILLLVNGIENLGDEEASFIRYLSTKRALVADNEMPVLFVIARAWALDSHPLDPYLPADRRPIDMPADATTPAEHDEGEDIRVQALASAVLEGPRSDARRRLLAYAASHPSPFPIEWAREFSGASAAEFADDVAHLATRHLLSKVILDGRDALQAAPDARAVVEKAVSRDIVAECHRDLVARVTREIDLAQQPGSSDYELIAYHYALLDDDRQALVARIRAVKAAWREKSLSNVERLAQSSLEMLAESDTIHAKAARRYFVKQWVLALWARNQHTRAKRVIDDHFVNHGDVIPPGLLPKYIRGILDAEGPAPALKSLDGVATERLSVNTNQQLLVERALLLYHCARHEESLAILKPLDNSRTLSRKDCYRVTIYRAMNLAGIGADSQVEDLLRNASDRARADHCYDEFVLMSAIRVQVRTRHGQPQDSLRIIARTLPVAHRHELHFRLNVLYRLAASAYQDLGQPRKAILSQRRAIALASALGLPQFEAMSWSRLSEYERILGNFGNTIRYLNKASTVMAKSSYEADRAQLNLAEIQIHAWLRSPEMYRVINNATWIEGIKDVTERGRYFMMLGSHWMDMGDWDKAWSCFDRASELLQRAGFVDNLIVLRRARLRLSLLSGRAAQSVRERRAINVRALKTVDSTNGQLERSLALLEFAYNKRVDSATLLGLCDACLHLCNESTEAISRLEALSLVFRTYARRSMFAQARGALKQLHTLLKAATSNLDDSYVAGLMDRLDLAQLTREYALMEERNKAGVDTGLVA